MVFEKEYQVAKVGWDKENPIANIVLLDAKEREFLGLEVESIVKVKKVCADAPVSVECLAVLHPQFRELIRKEVTTLSKKLGETLEVKEGEKVIISKEVTESELENFKRAAFEEGRSLFFRGMGFRRWIKW